jgi:hypothetical protein
VLAPLSSSSITLWLSIMARSYMLFEGVSCKPWVTGVATHLSVGVVGVFVRNTTRSGIL